MKHAILVLLAAWAATAVQAQPAPARGTQAMVTAVVDGDTLVLTPAQGAPVTVRLYQIDAPERCQPWGPESRRALAALALNKHATLVQRGRDRSGAVIGSVRIDELDLSRFQVENGQAWSQRTRFDRGPLVKQERMAKALSRGLHSQPGAIAPWDFRQRHGVCKDG